MEKAKLLEEISALAKSGGINKGDVLGAFDSGRKAAGHTDGSSAVTVADVLSFVGGLVVIIGIVVLVSDNWSSLGSITRVLATLGFAMAAYVSGVLLQHQKSGRFQLYADILFCIASVLLPLGFGVLFNETGFPWYESVQQVFLSGLSFAVVLGAFFALKRKLFVIFAVGYGTWCFFAFLHFIHPQASVTGREYVSLFTGLAYLFLAFSFSKTTLRPLAGFMYFVGSATVFGCALALGEWEPHTILPMLWQLIFPLVVAGMIVLSVRVHAMSLLVTSAIGVVAYIIKLTAEYFSDSIGWPLALVFAGFLLMGAGYLMVRIKRKYLMG